jgi:hypothetical protein
MPRDVIFYAHAPTHETTLCEVERVLLARCENPPPD